MLSLKLLSNGKKIALGNKLIINKNFFDFGTIKTFILPDLGEKIKEATIKEWHVKVGDTVEEFQTLADVSTDKLFTQIPSDFNGKIHKLYYEEEENALIGKPFVDIEVEDGEYAASENDKQSPNSATSDQPATSHVEKDQIDYSQKHENNTQNQTQNKQKGATLATPYVRGLAKNQGIDIDSVVGSGPEGRVLEEDLQKYGKRSNQYSPATRSLAAEYGIDIHQVTGTGRDGLILKSDILDYVKANNIPSKSVQTMQDMKKPLTQQKQQSPATLSDQKLTTEKIQMDGFARGMQKSMTAANSIPHLYVQEEIDLTEAKAFRETLKKNNQKITFMSIFVKAFSLALTDYPIINSLYDPETPFEYKIAQNHNITVAINSPHGLVVPNIKNVQNLSLLQIQHEINALREKADKGQLGPKELYDGTVSISNVGVVGGTYASPLLFAPQTSIVAVGRMMEVPKFVGNQVVPRSMINVSLGCDHRVIDGATAAGFLMRWKFLLENPSMMLVQMK